MIKHITHIRRDANFTGLGPGPIVRVKLDYGAEEDVQGPLGVIDNIRSLRDRYFSLAFVNNGRVVAPVEVVPRAYLFGQEHIRTARDTTAANNLDNLPTF